MQVSYKKLWRLLARRRIDKKKLQTITGISPSTIAKLQRNENVNMDVLLRLCAALHADFGDIMEAVESDT